MAGPRPMELKKSWATWNGVSGGHEGRGGQTHRLAARAVNEIEGVAHADDEDEVEEEADKVSECGGVGDGFGHDS